MSGKYKFHNPKGMYFVSWAVVYWIDVLCAMNTVCYLLKVWTIVAKTHQSDIRKSSGKSKTMVDVDV